MGQVPHLRSEDALRNSGQTERRRWEFDSRCRGRRTVAVSFMATWNQTTHVNLQRFLNSANGGSVPWENAIDRKGKKQAMEEQVRASPNVPGDRTNVSTILFQQCSVFSNWWAAGELKQAIGLPQRCVFSFGAVREPGPPWLQGFESEVVIPLGLSLDTENAGSEGSAFRTGASAVFAGMCSGATG